MQDHYQSFFLRQECDTASPRSNVPVYFVHDVDAPFCTNPNCTCHQSLIEVETLLHAIDAGVLGLQRADNFRERA